jgi:hypothetical protein
VFLGTSRLGPAAAEATAAHLGLDKDGIVDYSYPATTFWWAATLLRRNPDIWENGRVVVIDILPFQLYENQWHAESSPLFRRYASLPERWQAPNLTDRIAALAELALPVQSQSRSLKTWYAALRDVRAGAADVHAPLLFEGRVELPAGVPASTQSEPRSLPTDFTDEAINFAAYLRGRTINETQRRAVQWLTEHVPEGSHLLFIMPPIVKNPNGVLAGSPGYLERYIIFRDFMRGLKSDRVTVRFYEDPDEFGLTRADFDDGIHFSVKGMDKAGAILASTIREAVPNLPWPSR